MRVENARRLTGRGFFSPAPGAAVELWLEGEPWGATRSRWRDILSRLLSAIGLGDAPIWEHLRTDGFTTAVGCPIDRCLALADALEWAGYTLVGDNVVTFEEAVHAFEGALAEQENAALLALEAAAKAHGVPFLWDEDAVSLGLGTTAEVFPMSALPEVTAVEWERYGRVPVGLVTGTNGKTTTTRMVAKILTAAGHTVGMASTDAITVAGAVLEPGDWTGPGAARRVLRDARVTAAVLETARGGILRRGLAWDAVDAAAVTNIGEDHFGDFGITTLHDMARIKAVVWDAVRPGGKRIVNAACPISADYIARELPRAVGADDWVFVAREPGAPLASAHRRKGGEAWYLEGGALTHEVRGAATPVVRGDEIPVTFGGVATHNVDNALMAAALAHALGADHGAIARGLTAFEPRDNPGRLELHEVAGVRILLDFGHNPHGVSALAPIVASLRRSPPGARLMVVTGQAGDRSDHDLFELGRAIMTLSPQRVAVRPMRGYERGRAKGEVEAVLLGALATLGIPEGDALLVEDEVGALGQALAWARPGDVVLVLVHIEREAVRDWLAAQR